MFMKRTGLVIIVILIALFVIFHGRKTASYAPSLGERSASSTDTYISQKYGFQFMYPHTATVIESIFDDGINMDSWTIIEQRAVRPAAQPVDCGIRYPDELYFGISIADLAATSTNMQQFSKAFSGRYDDASYMSHAVGDQLFKVRRNIPGMCGESTEVLWKDSSGRYLFSFGYPSDTAREQDYWDIIQSFHF